MKRVVLAVAGGFVVPFIYSIIVGPLSTYIESDAIHQALYVPIGWPKLFLQRVVPLGFFPFRDADASALLIYIVACDVVGYSCLSYFVLWRFSRRKKAQPQPPPIPPTFD